MPQPDGSSGVVPGSPFELEHSGQIPVEAMNDNMMFSDQGGSLFGPGSLNDNLLSTWQQTWQNASLTSNVESFKGPIDFLYPNGNYGVGLGINAGIPISQEYGIGVQAGVHATRDRLARHVQRRRHHGHAHQPDCAANGSPRSACSSGCRSTA